MNPRLAVNHNPNLPYTGPKGGAAAALPSKCLEDPDDPDCLKLRKLPGNANAMDASGVRPGAQAATVANENSAVAQCSQEGEVKLTTQEDSVGLPAGAVEVAGSAGTEVTFKITQLWKLGTVGWIQPVFRRAGKPTCDPDNHYSAQGGFARQFVADCVGGKASLDLYVQDGAFVDAHVC